MDKGVNVHQEGDKQLGEALKQEGLITENQLQHAVQLQQESLKKRRFGDLLVELGYLTKRQLREIARKYNHRVHLGEILVDGGILTDEKLEEALDTQKVSKKLLGEILIDSNTITEEQFAMALSQQFDYPYIVPDKRLIDKKLLQLFPEDFLRQHMALPVWKNEEVVTVIVQNPLDQTLHSMLKHLFGSKYELAIAPKALIKKVLREIMEERTLFSKGAAPVIDQSRDKTFQRYNLDQAVAVDSPTGQIINIVDYILCNAIQERASDIHIEPLYDKLRVRYRIDGKLVYKTDLPKNISDSLMRRIKVISKIDIADSKENLEGHVYVSLNNKDIDLRVAIYPTVLGEAITIRILTKEIGLRDLEDLGMLPKVLTILKKILDTPSGLILFTGPTGSGKTTSLYACLNYMNKTDVKIVTIEDPVEYSIEGISQCQIKDATEKQMSDRIKSMMHQDPDVLVMGEISNEITAVGSVQAGLSGHKVFSTIHTDDSIGAILRLIELGLRTYLLSSTGIAVLSQRLVRKICRNCKEPYTPSKELFKEFKLKDIDPDFFDFYHGKGCVNCNYSGFFGRTGVFELLALNDEIRSSFLENNNASVIRKIAHNTGNYLSLREAGFIKALQGETTLDEAMGLLSYNEKETVASMDLKTEDIKYWMEEE